MRAASVTLFLCVSLPTVFEPTLVRAANCALRNPDRQIHTMFPDHTSYRSVVATVDDPVRKEIEKQLGSEVALNDLGKHTLYLVLKKKTPIGFIHARSEIGESGTVEIVWALDLDMNVKDFQIQRSRERQTATVKDDSFRRKMIGSDVYKLLGYLGKRNAEVDTKRLEVSEDAARITQTTVLCGAKCILVTENAFKDLVFRSRLLGNLYRFFPNAKKALDATKSLGGERNQKKLHDMRVLKAHDAKGNLQGMLVFSRWAEEPSTSEIWWAVTGDGTIKDVVIKGKVTAKTRSSIKKLAGKKVFPLARGNDEGDSSRAAACAADLAAVLKKLKVVD
jgi:hypothetical protein